MLSHSPVTIHDQKLSHRRNTSLKVEQIMLVGVGRGGGGEQSIHFHTARLRSEVQPLPFHIPYLISLPKRTPLTYIIHQKIVTPSFSLKIRRRQNNIPTTFLSLIFFVWPKIYVQFVPPFLILVFKWAVSLYLVSL